MPGFVSDRQDCTASVDYLQRLFCDDTLLLAPRSIRCMQQSDMPSFKQAELTSNNGLLPQRHVLWGLLRTRTAQGSELIRVDSGF
jgi:hypothetical protein